LAEDNRINQKLMSSVLGRLGYRPDIANNGMEALDALRRQRYDLILMDVQMPVLDGISSTKRIRAELPSEEQPHIIAVTADATNEDRARCLAAGMDDHMGKPFSVETLRGVLQRAARNVEDPGAGTADPSSRDATM